MSEPIALRHDLGQDRQRHNGRRVPPSSIGNAGAQRVPGEDHELSVGRRVAERARPDPADVEQDATDVGPVTTDRERGVARAGRPYDAESQPAMSPADGIRP
jgi:hypothetical protein